MRSPVVAVLATALLAAMVAAPPAEAAGRKPVVMLLNSLPVTIEASSGYARSAFRHWVDADENGCDTREEVLIAERISGSVSGCEVLDGSWRSEYDGLTTSDPGSFDIDHRVPLKEAWESGAWRWTASTRQAFANDLGYGQSLIAVTARTNRSKSDRDPADWLPPLASDRCAYARQWVAVKYRWRLAVDSREKSVLGRLLTGCARNIAVPARAATMTDPQAERPSGSAGAAPDQSPAPVGGAGGVDPRFGTCGAANDAGYGPYARGQDAEYDWYIDRDSDGIVCEP